jgi:ribulose-5-phosphate 4-epimerase/fuculose-1-phosphate aldolase
MYELKVRSEVNQAKMTADEWEARVTLAACYRLVDHYGMSDLIYTHISMRLPADKNQFLINALGLLFSEQSASTLVRVDAEGHILADTTGLGVNVAGFIIHSAVHEARPDVNCVLHTHTIAGMAVSAHPDGLLPITQHAMMLQNDIAYHDYEGVSIDLGERQRLARDLGNHNVMILRNHGLLTCGNSVAEAFVRMMMLDRACQAQVAALSGGITPRVPSGESIAVTAGFNYPNHRRDGSARLWSTLIRMLDRKDPSFRQ